MKRPTGQLEGMYHERRERHRAREGHRGREREGERGTEGERGGERDRGTEGEGGRERGSELRLLQLLENKERKNERKKEWSGGMRVDGAQW